MRWVCLAVHQGKGKRGGVWFRDTSSLTHSLGNQLLLFSSQKKESDYLSVGSVRGWHWCLSRNWDRERKEDEGECPMWTAATWQMGSALLPNNIWCKFEWRFRLDHLTLAWNGQVVLPVQKVVSSDNDALSFSSSLVLLSLMFSLGLFLSFHCLWAENE